MSLRRRELLGALGLVFLGGVALFYTQHLTAPKSAPPKERFAALREKAKVPAIAFAAVTRERDVLVGVEGAVTDDATAFEAASIAKPIIGIAVMQLVEKGLLDLDADVETALGFAVRHPKASTTKITLRMLLSHTASIADDATTSAPPGPPLETFLRDYLARPSAWIEALPGTEARYSNVGPSLAALAVERSSHLSFADYATANVFRPLHLERTSFREARPPCAAPSAFRDGGFIALPPPAHALYPAVDLFSTAGDLAKLARAILKGGEGLLAPESTRTMIEENLGWQHRTFGTRKVVGHEGEDKGASTGFYLDRARGVGAVVMANGDAFTSNDHARARALEELLDALFQDAIAWGDAN